jgi:hypothetical protein
MPEGNGINEKYYFKNSSSLIYFLSAGKRKKEK